MRSARSLVSRMGPLGGIEMKLHGRCAVRQLPARSQTRAWPSRSTNSVPPFGSTVKSNWVPRTPMVPVGVRIA